jgi:hypothetical protein
MFFEAELEVRVLINRVMTGRSNVSAPIVSRCLSVISCAADNAR